MGRHAAPGSPDDNPRPRGPVADPFATIQVGEPFAPVPGPTAPAAGSTPVDTVPPADVAVPADVAAQAHVAAPDGTAGRATAPPAQHASVTAATPLSWRAGVVLGAVAGSATAAVLLWVGTGALPAVAAALAVPAVVMAAVWLARRLPGRG